MRMERCTSDATQARLYPFKTDNFLPYCPSERGNMRDLIRHGGFGEHASQQ